MDFDNDDVYRKIEAIIELEKKSSDKPNTLVLSTKQSELNKAYDNLPKLVGIDDVIEYHRYVRSEVVKTFVEGLGLEDGLEELKGILKVLGRYHVDDETTLETLNGIITELKEKTTLLNEKTTLLNEKTTLIAQGTEIENYKGKLRERLKSECSPEALRTIEKLL